MTRKMKQLTLTASVFLSLVGLSFSDEGKKRNHEWFNELDADGDGRVSKKEYVDAWNARFSGQDKDDDGYLSFTEWLNLGSRDESKSRKVFDHYDKDDDEQISKAEYATFRSVMFDNSDTDKDGYWSKGETKRKQKDDPAIEK